jgi:hypothetical protein
MNSPIQQIHQRYIDLKNRLDKAKRDLGNSPSRFDPDIKRTRKSKEVQLAKNHFSTL